jgi:hypothetical protein
MFNKTNTLYNLGIKAAVAGLLLTAGAAAVNAQSRDPFKKPGYAIQRNPGTVSVGQGGRVSAGAPAMPGLPSIEQRIDYYKRLREQAAQSGSPLPKVTSVLTLNDMAVTGIFRTPRGYAAMVEATPIKLSYTIYPGEKFFDGQLVAVEENRLVFRRVTKVGSGKFVSSVENKPLRQYSTKAQIEGTAPAQPADRSEPAAAVRASADKASEKAEPAKIISPLDEMNKQGKPEASEKEKSAKNGKKSVKVARNQK